MKVAKFVYFQLLDHALAPTSMVKKSAEGKYVICSADLREKLRIFKICTGHLRPFQEILKTCDKMQAEIPLGDGVRCVFLFLRFYNFIKGTLRIYTVS